MKIFLPPKKNISQIKVFFKKIGLGKLIESLISKHPK